ncbi:putative porin [Halpernia frigidisoli]|uniref:Putative porin n=1 Tax=Halpernia frigidisoli TaxID=1125876 RepID=A0A1I3GKA5_9FLAO|nr:putative porin [Halpernia frigidisoli]SFI23917.1 Putative porin [Halpernia frigidisoli]
MKYLFLSLFFCLSLKAQVINKTDGNQVKSSDTLVIDAGVKDSLKIFKPTINDYLYQTQLSEKKIFDTVLSQNKTFIFSQYNNQDNFGKIQFANIGSGFQNMVYSVNSEKNLSLLPENKSFTILKIDDIKYYDVKTPTAAFIYHNAVNNGAVLNSTYTQNIGARFNFAIDYFGLRSLGNYQNSLAANNNTSVSAHYISKNKRYQLFAHYISQNVNNQEYGGITDVGLFLAGDSRFSDRQNFQVNLLNSNSEFRYRRYYLSQEFAPFNVEKYPFKIRNTTFSQVNKYYFGRVLEPFYFSSPNDLIPNFPPFTKKYSQNFSNTTSLVFDKEKFKFDAGLRYQKIKTGATPGVISDLYIIPTDISENRIGAVGNLQIKLINRIDLKSFFEFSQGSAFGTFIKSENLLSVEPINGYKVDAHVNFQSSSPTFNLLENTSVYRKFNYYLKDANNETVTDIGGKINLKWFNAQLFGNYYRIDNYTYLDANAQPQQSGTSLNISKVGGEATLDYSKFHLNGKVLFQSALTNKDLLPMPNFIGRANIYYQTKAFKNAAEIQAGVKVYYFSKFASREYFPILNEFILPDSNSTSIGGQPIADGYINFKVKRLIFFVEAQHFDTTFSQNKSFTAPDYPLYDFRLNLGIVWYLFN